MIMKKLLLLFAVTLLSFCASAQTVLIDRIYYELNSTDKTAKVTGNPKNYYGNSYSGNVVIPQSVTYHDIIYDVICIGYKAFYNCTKLTKISIPNSIAIIEGEAFCNCSELTKISIPNSIVNIEGKAFSDCTNLTSVNITDIGSWCRISFDGVNSNPLAYAHHLLIDDKEVIDLTIPDSVESISPYAFYGCSELSSVTLSNNVKTVGQSAFCGTNLNKFVVGTGVVKFDDIIFGSVYYNVVRPIKTIWLTNTPPNNYTAGQGIVNYVANNQYTSIENKKEYKFLSSMFEVDGVIYVPVSPSDRTCDVIDCVYDISKTEVDVKSTVSNQGIDLKVLDVQPYTFYGNTNLQKASFDISGTLGKYVFYNCNNLAKVTLGNNVLGIDEYAFSGCSKLESIVIPDAVKTIGQYAFAGCSNMASAIIGNGAGIISQYAFENCSNLTSVFISNGTYAINHYVFSGCSALPKIDIPGSVSYIGGYAFAGCNSLKEVVMEKRAEGVIRLSYDDWIYSTSNPRMEIDVFVGDTLSFDYNVSIGSLQVSLPGGDYSYCHGAGSFKAVCSKYNGHVTLTLNAQGHTGAICGVTNIQLSKNTILLLCPNGEQPLFADCPLDSVYIGRNIGYYKESLYGYSPFYRNTTLRSVMITDKEEEISENEFYGCTNLQNVQIGDGVTTIGSWAFSGCSSLNHLGFGTQVKTIGKEAFSDCTAVTEIISKASTPPACGDQALDDINKWTCNLIVPKGCVAAYQAADQWKEFFFVAEGNDSDVTPVGNKCATPTISYSQGKLSFESATEGAEFEYSITDADIKSGTANEVMLCVTYTISVYASKAGYENSSVTTATLCWIDVEPKTEGITNNIANIPAKAILVQTAEGTINVQGADDGELINVYGINGIKAGSSVSQNGVATINTSLKPGTVAIIKVGQKSVKVVMK